MYLLYLAIDSRSMIKSLIISLISLVTLFVNYLYTQEVNLYAKYPTEAKAGETIQVEITVEKGNLSEFGRFVQELPAGFTAESKDKLFSFSENKVKFLWVTLPVSSSYTFSYSIKIPASFTGNCTLEGQFAYILDNERKTAMLPPYTIGIKPSGTPDAEINRKDAFASNGSKMPSEETVVAQRRIKETNNTQIVKISIAKNELSGMAKVTENIPDGYTAEVIEKANGIFTQEGSTIKFLWMDIPSDKNIEVSYRLIKARQNAAPLNIQGNFSYSNGGVTKTIAIELIHDDFKLSEKEIASTKSVVGLPAKESYSTSVTYKVQIAAGHKLVDIRKYFKKFGIKDNVSVAQHEGWHKYTVGKFSDYKSARDYRVSLWNDTKVKDAFVAAYNGNQRITVQEALMIASHKWYQ